MSMPGSNPDDRGYEPAGYPAPFGDQPPRPPAPGSRLGRASGVELRQESQYASSNTTLQTTVLAFRLVEPGNPRPLDVVLRGRSLMGTVREGDWIEIAGAPDAMGRYDVAKAQNLTTGSTVVVIGGRRSAGAKVVAIAVLLFFLVVIVVFIVIGLAFVGHT